MWHRVVNLFVLLAGIVLFTVSIVAAGIIAGITYHNYKVKKRGLCKLPKYR